MILASYLALCLVWGSTYIGIRIVVEAMGPLWFAGTRFLLSGLLLLGVCRLIRAPLPKRGEWGPVLVMSLLYIVLGNAALCWGLQYVKGGVGANIGPLNPLVVALIMALLPRGERLSLAGWTGLVLGIGGVAMLLRDKISGASLGGARGELALLGALLAWSAGTVYGRYHSSRYHPLALVAFQMLIGGSVLTALAAAFENPWHREPSAETWFAYAYMVLVGGCVGFLAFTVLLQHMPATKASTYGYVNPAVAMGLGALLGHERYASHELVGSAVILAAVCVVHAARVRA